MRMKKKSLFLENLCFGTEIVSVRKDDYKHEYYAVIDGETFPVAKTNTLSVSEQEMWVDGDLKLSIRLDVLEDVEVEKLFLRTGIDCYMERYPEWNEIFFPTMLKCEKTHFNGYLQTPNGRVLGLASPQPFDAWSLDYNRAIYGEENHVGHRIYSFCLHLFNAEKQMFEGKGGKRLYKGERYEYDIYFGLLSGIDKVFSFWKKYTNAPKIESRKWTYELGEKICVESDGELTVTAPNGTQIQVGDTLMQNGLYCITAKKADKISKAYVFVRNTLDEYLAFAAECAFRYPQRASTHAETYYGYFSAFAYALHSHDKAFLQKTEKDFAQFLKTIENKEGRLCEAAFPKRIQNVSTLISLFVLAYKASDKKYYIQKALDYADVLMKEQAESGEYLGWGYAHYTCVIYPAKSMLELSDLLGEIQGYEKEREKVYTSASLAIADLSVRLDNIHTEGQQTFEDGMISCAALQLGMAALRDVENRQLYIDCAEKLLRKHECLEQQLVADGRMRGCTLRFWESMYDVLIDCNMINSPHGWTGWKTYATFYLYLLTNNIKYLKDTFDTLGAQLQCFDIENNRLNWAFIVDPVLKTEIFDCKDGQPRLTPTVFGDCYLPMISDYWRSNREEVCYGYAFPKLGLTKDIYQGGCCDNDVHEHIKCMEEVGLNAFIHEEKGEIFAYNCELQNGQIILHGEYLKNLYFYSQTDCEVIIQRKLLQVKKGMNCFKLSERKGNKK